MHQKDLLGVHHVDETLKITKRWEESGFSTSSAVSFNLCVTSTQLLRGPCEIESLKHGFVDQTEIWVTAPLSLTPIPAGL
jgi:hypothetical protein